MASAPIRVLIADDDERFLQSLQTLIDGQPELEVVAVARDGDEAVELGAELTPEAAVIDLHMPRLEGIEAVRRLRQRHPSLCLIALTGDPSPKLRNAAERAGADGVFLKGELLDRLLERLSRARAGGAARMADAALAPE
jgi:DNA-binding NarL/FixJ family response regulator